mgnify:CR=1 FL=1|tara:strand:+ start:37 stop:1269 length:1233 start_codon:yes stop_codon:yes gene_type:complete
MSNQLNIEKDINNNLQNVKADKETTPVNISKNKVQVDGDLDVTGDFSAAGSTEVNVDTLNSTTVNATTVNATTVNSTTINNSGEVGLGTGATIESNADNQIDLNANTVLLTAADNSPGETEASLQIMSISGSDASLILREGVSSTRYIGIDASDGDKLKIGIGATVGANESIILDASDCFHKGSVSIKEKASAIADTASYGQLWVKTATPNQLYFTTDAGDDIQLTDGTSTAGGGGSTTLKHWMDWYYVSANLATQNYFYAALHNDEFGVSSSINTDLSSSGYSTTSLNNMWRWQRYARRIPYSGTVTKLMVHLESTGAAADSDVEVALWYVPPLTLDTSYASTANATCDHLGTITFDFSNASRNMTKELTSFNATSVTQGGWFFITLRKITSGDGSSFNCHPTVLWDGS